jgi:hypothetical protein
MEFPSSGIDGDEKRIEKESGDGKVCRLWGRESGRE